MNRAIPRVVVVGMAVFAGINALAYSVDGMNGATPLFSIGTRGVEGHELR